MTPSEFLEAIADAVAFASEAQGLDLSATTDESPVSGVVIQSGSLRVAILLDSVRETEE